MSSFPYLKSLQLCKFGESLWGRLKLCPETQFSDRKFYLLSNLWPWPLTYCPHHRCLQLCVFDESPRRRSKVMLRDSWSINEEMKWNLKGQLLENNCKVFPTIFQLPHLSCLEVLLIFFSLQIFVFICNEKTRIGMVNMSKRQQSLAPAWKCQPKATHWSTVNAQRKP